MPYPTGLSLHTIWDEIASLIDSTKDLLSLALTCHIFKELIIPDHLEFRHIRCDFRRNDVWKLLASRPRLTRGVRIVDLIYEPRESVRLPQALGWDKPDRTLHMNVPVISENMKLFKDALSYMTFLKMFSWKQYPAPFTEIIDISRVLTNTTHCLEALRVDFYWMSSLDDYTQFENLSVWYLTGLKKVTIRHPGPAAVRTIVHLCPDIEDLYLLDLSTTSLLYVTQHGNWKNLRRLNLSTDIASPNIFVQGDLNISTIIGSFLVRNSNIESLYLDLFDVPMPHLLCLPKLRSMGSNDCNLVLTSFLSSDTILGLVHWQCPIDYINIEALPRMDRLESFYFSTYNLGDFFSPFIQKAPNLKKMYLDIGKHWEINIPEILVNSRQCSKLTHLLCENGFPLVNILARKSFSEQVCKKLSALPALTYITQRDEELCVKLERDKNGMYSGYQLVTFQELEERPDCWGDFLLK